MAGHQCLRCRAALRQAIYIRQRLTTCKRQTHSSSEPANNGDSSTAPGPSDAPPKPQIDIKKLLSKPTWSVRSLFPPSSFNSGTSSPPDTAPDDPPTPSISPSQLHHLLRLSALPQPTSPAEEATMLSTLQTQLHFVRAIQAVDTTGVEPLVTIREETLEGAQEMTIGLENPRIKEALGGERRVGKMGRWRRLRGGDVMEDNAAGKEEVAAAIGQDDMKEGAGGKERAHTRDRRSEEEKAWNPLKGAQGRTVRGYFVVESGKKSNAAGPTVLKEGEPRET